MDTQELIELCSILMVVGGIVFVAMMVASIYKGKQVADSQKKDDNMPMFKVRGKVLEKTSETRRHSAGLEFEYTTEWIIFQQEDGSKRRLRNIVGKGIIIAAGEKGVLTYRGETIYGFESESE